MVLERKVVIYIAIVNLLCDSLLESVRCKQWMKIKVMHDILDKSHLRQMR